MLVDRQGGFGGVALHQNPVMNSLAEIIAMFIRRRPPRSAAATFARSWRVAKYFGLRSFDPAERRRDLRMTGLGLSGKISALRALETACLAVFIGALGVAGTHAQDAQGPLTPAPSEE